MIIRKALKIPTAFCARAFGSVIKTDKDKSSKIVAILRNALRDKDNTGGAQKGESQGLKDQSIDYYDLADKLKNLSDQNETVAMQIREVQESIKKAQEETFVGTPDIYKLISSASPKSDTLMHLFLEYAMKNAKSDEERLEVEYYIAYLEKLDALQKGDKQKFETSNEKFIELANQKSHPIAMHLIGKDLYKAALNLTGSKFKKSKKQYLDEAADLFLEAAQRGSRASFYYLGEMAEKGDIPGGVDMKQAYQYYLISASYDNPMAYFKLSRFHHEGFLVDKNPELEFHYMKKAGELGLVEAQHNLGVMYLEGKIVKYSGLKALSWFSHAGAAGFVHSQYNAAKMYLEGSNDDKVKVNYPAAMEWLEIVHKGGVIDVSKIIQVVTKALEEKAVEQENQEEISQKK